MLKTTLCALALIPAAALAEPATYASPEAAVQAFVDALNAQDRAGRCQKNSG